MLPCIWIHCRLTNLNSSLCILAAAGRTESRPHDTNPDKRRSGKEEESCGYLRKDSLAPVVKGSALAHETS